jgi:uncharacterized double-CXXCG motif protein
LPSRIGCPTCGVYGAVGASHPAIDLALYPGAQALEEPRGASWREFTALAGQLAVFLGTDEYFGPGDEFGTFTGMVRGEPADFIFGDVALLFITSEGLQRLTQAGAALPPAAPTTLRARRGASLELLELDLPRVGVLTDESYRFMSHRCGTCGRMEGPLERTILSRQSIGDEMDLLRPKNHATLILASERLRDLVNECELTGLAFKEVEISVQDV